jgi:hypothetical protein
VYVFDTSTIGTERLVSHLDRNNVMRPLRITMGLWKMCSKRLLEVTAERDACPDAKVNPH